MEVASGSYDRENFVGQGVDYNMLRAYCIYARYACYGALRTYDCCCNGVGGRVVGGE
jgi:hypothetical protein